MAFEQVGQSLDRFTRKSPIRAAATALQVEEESRKHLPEWAGMVSFREGRLILSAPSPAHAQELQLGSRELRKRINAGLGRKTVEEIRFRVGS